MIGVCGEGARGEEGNHDGELGGEEEGEVEEAGPGDWHELVRLCGGREVSVRTARVTAGEGLEAVHELTTAGAIRVPADTGTDHDPVCSLDVGDNGVEDVVVDAAEVGITARQQIRSGLAKDKLHALGDHESGRKRKAETHPARVQLPKLPPPDERLGGSATGSRTGNKDHAYEEDDEAGRDEGYDDKEPCGDHLMVLHGIRDVEVDGRERAVVWEDELQAAADGRDYAEAC